MHPPYIPLMQNFKIQLLKFPSFKIMANHIAFMIVFLKILYYHQHLILIVSIFHPELLLLFLCEHSFSTASPILTWFTWRKNHRISSTKRFCSMWDFFTIKITFCMKMGEEEAITASCCRNAFLFFSYVMDGMS